MARYPRAALALILLFAVSLALRLYPVLALRFDGLYGQDPFAYYSYGQQLVAAVSSHQLQGPFYWPFGYPALVALGFVIAGDQPLGPQAVSLIAGALISVFAYLIASEITQQIITRDSIAKPLPLYGGGVWGGGQRFARLAGLIAWAVTAICGQLIQSSMVIMSDSSALMWASLSAWSLLVYGRTRRPGWIALSAFALAWATMTRWQYGSLALPWALYVLVNRPFKLQHAALATIIGFAVLSPQIVYTLQNPTPFIGHEWVQGWSVRNAFAHDFVTDDGTFHYEQTPTQYYAQPLTFVYFMSPLLLPFLLIGLMFVARHIAIIVILGWATVQYGFLAGIPYENIRFALALFPPIAVCVGLGTAWLMLKPVRFRLLTVPIVSLVIIYGLLTTLRASVPIINGFVAAKDADLAATQWIVQQIPESNANVYCLDLLLMMQHYGALHPIQIYQMTTDTLRDQLPRTQPAYAVFNIGTTENQWRGKSPWIIYHWLLDNPGMTRIGSFGNYTLYRINS